MNERDQPFCISRKRHLFQCKNFVHIAPVWFRKARFFNSTIFCSFFFLFPWRKLLLQNVIGITMSMFFDSPVPKFRLNYWLCEQRLLIVPINKCSKWNPRHWVILETTQKSEKRNRARRREKDRDRERGREKLNDGTKIKLYNTSDRWIVLLLKNSSTCMKLIHCQWLI